MTVGIITLCIGADYTRAMEPGFESKRNYAIKHGYTFVLGGEKYWLRDRPIPWSKIPFFIEQLEKFDWVWFSDADSLITNPDIRVEDLIVKYFDKKPSVDAIWWRDGCGNINSGQILARGKSPLVKKWLEETAKQEDLLYHGWWENAGMIRVWETDPVINAGIELRTDYRAINSYLFVKPDYESWQRGDFVLHFAGVYEPVTIYRYMKYITECCTKGINPDMKLLYAWFNSPPASLKDVI